MDVDLSELDDWLGTLEELQLGLDTCRPAPAPNVTAQWSQGKSQFTPSHLNGPQSQLRALSNPSPLISTKSPAPISTGWNGPVRTHTNDVNRTVEHGVRPQEENAEGDLSCLLRELEVVEERMRVLEQDDSNGIQRYGISPPLVTTAVVAHQFKLMNQTRLSNGSNDHLLNQQDKPPTINGTGYSGLRSGLVSAQWASNVNHDAPPLIPGPQSQPTRSQKSLRFACLPPDSPDDLPAPQASPRRFLTPPANSCETSSKAEQFPLSVDPEKSASASQTTLVNAPINSYSTSQNGFKETDVANKMPPPPPPTRYLTKPMCPQTDSDYRPVVDQLRVFQTIGAPSWTPSTQSANSSLPASPSLTRANPLLIDNFSSGCSQSPHQVTQNHVNKSPTGFEPSTPTSPNSTNGGTRSALSAKNHLTLSSEELIQTKSQQHWLGMHSYQGEMGNNSRETALPPIGGDRLSNSLSPDSSLSERSLSDVTDFSRRSDFSTDSSNLRKPIFVRVFRHDRTTKAVLVEEHTTAGEVASMLIEKNFMQPSTSLVLVEKVPSMKIERIFEEHQRVSDCILSWCTRSQNMIFFEERPEHFGFIEVPNNWLGDAFVQKHGYQSSEAMQASLKNLDKVGFPEYRDYLYIRKPGEKTWSRRLCVLRNSGLYTSKKNKKSLNATDLIRILILDSQLQLYTTTGGWSRMRAPTPHGFAFKPYSANELSSIHVFCFCATDERSLRQWVCRLRIAKYGSQLLTDYQTATSRVQRLTSIRQGSIGSSLLCLSASPMSVQLHRKSTIDMLCSSQAALSAAESTSSLAANVESPSLIQKFSSEHRQSMNSPNGDLHSKHVTWNYSECQSPSPRLLRSRHSTGGSRNSADYSSKAETVTGSRTSVPQSNLMDANSQDVGPVYRPEKQTYSPNCYNPQKFMNGTHLLPSGVPRPRV